MGFGGGGGLQVDSRWAWVWIDDVMNVDGRRGGCRYRDSPLDLMIHN